MVKAKDMVRLSEELNDRLTAITSTTSSTDAASAFNNPSSSSALSTHYSLDARAEPEEATFIRSSLAQLGLSMPNAPVTQAMVKDEHKWTEELARELTSVLQGSNNVRPTATGKKHEGIMRERGIVALDEIWGAWNRARGIGACTRSYTIRQILTSFHRTHSTFNFPHRNTVGDNLYISTHPSPHVCIWLICPPHTTIHLNCVCSAACRVTRPGWTPHHRANCSGGADHNWLG